MKITKEQREKIIKDVIEKIKSGIEPFLCIALGCSIQSILHVDYDSREKSIQKYIPGFKRSIADKYFSTVNHDYIWWYKDKFGRQHRLQFLRYLLNGKLPKRLGRDKHK